jgi:hypothetical protein
MILFLDDTELRHRYFTRTHIGKDAIHVWSASQAIAALENSPITETWLDHDLAYEYHGAEPVSFAQGTGLQVARWLAASEYPRSLRIIVHSLNPVGSKLMVETLRAAGFVNVKQEPWRMDPQVMAGL